MKYFKNDVEPADILRSLFDLQDAWVSLVNARKCITSQSDSSLYNAFLDLSHGLEKQQITLEEELYRAVINKHRTCIRLSDNNPPGSLRHKYLEWLREMLIGLEGRQI